MSYAIELSDVTKTFGPQTAVEDLNLRVPTGSMYGFIGPNGSGKTTTLRMITRILMPDRGVVRVLGEDHHGPANDRIAYLPEERGLYKQMKVRELLRFYSRLKSHTPAPGEIDSWLERMQLTGHGDKKIEQLSKGMSQKVQFIATVIARPELVLLDEPFSGLDPINATVLREMMLDLKKQGTTVIFSTHDMSVAEKMCDFIFMIYRGRKMLDGTLEAIQRDYGADTVRVEFRQTKADSNHALDDLPGVLNVADFGKYQELRVEKDCDSQRLLGALMQRGEVSHFEIAHPTLQDIFIRIANGKLISMGKSFAIAAREYNAAVKTKAFVISVVLLPVMLSATFILRHLTERLGDSGDKRYVFVDRSSNADLFNALNSAVDKRNKDGVKPAWNLERIQQSDSSANQRYQLSEQIRHGTLAGFIEINGKEIIYHSNTPAYFDFRDFAGRQINEALRRDRLTAAGFPAAKVEPLLASLPVEDGGLAKLDSATGAVVNDKAPNAVAALIVPFALVMLMFLVIVVGAIPMMQGVIEEKQQRIAEVLLASVRPFQLMTGKLIGMTAISMTLIAIYGLGGLWIAGKTTFDISSYVTPSVMAWFFLFQILAVLMFGSMYIAVGASCTDMKEAQALLLPLNLLIMLPLMLLADVIQHPTGPLARWASLFPTAAPMLTIARIAASPAIPLWEKLVPAVITFTTTLLFVWAAGRIFRAGLMAGKASLGSMLAWVIRG